VVDVRRTDFENVAIRSALNLPAHSFYPTLPGVLRVLGEYEAVVFHCNSCSPDGRGDRCARWYQQALDEAGLSSQSQTYILNGGIKAWTAEFGEDDELSVKL
jgi:arsenical-resistance protein 2